MKRRLYLGGALAFALIAALLTLRAQHTIPVVVATHDLKSGVMITSDDVRVVRMHDDSVPGGAVGSTDSAIGRYVSWPLTSGEPVVSGSMSSASTPGAAAIGMDLPTGYSAVAVPVQPAAAVGGMLAPGDRVDIYATPAHPTDGNSLTVLSDASATLQSRLLGHDVLVIQLRTDQGQSLDATAGSTTSTVHGLNFGSGKLGSVVVAVPTGDVPVYAQAINADVIYLSLTVS